MAATLMVGQTAAGVNKPVQVDPSGKLKIAGVELSAFDASVIEGNLNTISADCSELVLNSSKIPGLLIPAHDYMEFSYTGTNLTGVIYKQGGSSGTIVATLALTYDRSNNLTSVAKS